MIKRAFFASFVAWLVCGLIVTATLMARSRVPLRETSLHDSFIVLAWCGVVMLAVFSLVVVPVYLYIPQKIRSLSVPIKGIIGALSGGLVFLVVFPFWLGIHGALGGAIGAGLIIGLMVPRAGPSWQKPHV